MHLDALSSVSLEVFRHWLKSRSNRRFLTKIRICKVIRQVNHDSSRRPILCRIAHIGGKRPVELQAVPPSAFADKTEVSNSDQLLLRTRAIMMNEPNTSAVSFRSLS